MDTGQAGGAHTYMQAVHIHTCRQKTLIHRNKPKNNDKTLFPASPVFIPPQLLTPCLFTLTTLGESFLALSTHGEITPSMPASHTQLSAPEERESILSLSQYPLTILNYIP